MNENLRQEFLVVGGGIGGMAAAIALRRRQVAVELIDIDPEWKVYGAGITITGPTLRFSRPGPLRRHRDAKFLSRLLSTSSS